MASFLDNTSDIILDAVLTDYGRQLLAKGDGTFNIVKFAFGDDEINYQLYDTGAVSPNQDIDIMATPVMEALTNNAASMKSKLLTIQDNKLLFLPIIKLNTKGIDNSIPTGSFNSQFTGFVVPVNPANLTTTTDALKVSDTLSTGVLANGKFIMIDQGIDSADTSATQTLKGTNLYETDYLVYMDSNLLSLNFTAGTAATNTPTPLSIDDDGVATYKISEADINNFKVIPIESSQTANSVIAGKKGSRILFGLTPSDNLQQNVYFNKYGTSGVQLVSGSPFKVIRTSVKVEGATTGYQLDIPVLLAKV